jgi:hypothetical protein
MTELSGSAPPSVLRLLSSLAYGTNSGRIAWNQTGEYGYRFDGGKGYVTFVTTQGEDDPFVLRIFDESGTELEAYGAPTRFSDQDLDVRMTALWSAIVRQRRGKTVEPVISSLIEAAGGEPPPQDVNAEPDDLDSLPF